MKTLDENQLQGICRSCGRKYRCKDALRYLDMQGCNQYEVLTNEEWFCHLTTEEKAEWLSKYFHCGDCIFEEPMCGGEYDGCKSAFVKWLKEIHHAN